MDDFIWIEDQGDATIAQNCRRRDAWDLAVIFFETFDNHLAGVVNAIHQKGGAIEFIGFHHDQDAIGDIVKRVPQVERLPRIHERHQFTAILHHARMGSRAVDLHGMG